jgi:predicted nucleotidyltransferase
MPVDDTCDRVHWYRLKPEQKAEVTQKITVLLRKKTNVKSAWIFGSFTEEGGIRDIDVAIETASEYPFKEYLNLNGELSLALGVPVDLVEMDRAPASLKEKIIKNGIKIK